MSSKVITLEADMEASLADTTTQEARDGYVRYVFEAYTRDNPGFNSVGEPSVEWANNIRDGFLTAKISFEVELSE